MYEPQEDSYFLKEIVEKFAFGKCLDMGCGTGIIGNVMLKLNKVTEVHFADINLVAIDFVKRTIKSNKRVKFFVTDLFSKIPKDEVYDTIAFNPPYLKGNYFDDIEIFGGKHGNEIILRFLNDAIEHLSDNGQIILLFSQESEPNVIKEKIREHLLIIEHEYQRSLFFETHYVLVIKKSELRKELEKRFGKIKFFTKGWRSYIYVAENKNLVIKINKHFNSEEIKKEYIIMKSLQQFEFIPRVYDIGCCWFSMEKINGIDFKEILKKYRNKKIEKKTIYGLIKKLIFIAHQLDLVGIKKEEFNRPGKNIVVDLKTEKIWLIDFDKAKNGIGNLNEFMSFIMNNFTEMITCEKQRLIQVLKDYKKTKNLNKVLECLSFNIFNYLR